MLECQLACRRAKMHPQCKRKKKECKINEVRFILFSPPHLNHMGFTSPSAAPVLAGELAPTSQHGKVGWQVVSQAAVGHVSKGVS